MRARSERVALTLLCNQRCGFCTSRQPVEDAATAAAAAVRDRLQAAIDGGAEEILLTGGEPTLRRELPAIVAWAKRAGARRVILETNGALLDAARVGALVRAGLDAARVHLPAWGAVCDAITEDTGGFARTEAALGALAAAGLGLEVATPLVRANRALVAELPARLKAAGLPVRVLWAGVPVRAFAPETLLPLDEAAAVLAELARAGRGVGLPVQVDPSAPLPPCLLPDPARHAHLFALTRGGAERADHVHPPPCADCVVRDRCPGVPRAALERTPALAVRPIGDDWTRRRLSLVSTVAEQQARELVTKSALRLADGTTVPESLVRVNFHCNQACRFCFVSTHLPPPDERAVEAAIDEIAAAGGVLTLSGGEPTLHPRLVELVRRGKAGGARKVELQTNATRLGDGERAAALAAAGLDSAFVSLHARQAEISDAITEAPGTFEDTVRGLDALASAGVALRLNFVFCQRNRGEFPDYVDWVAERWPGAAITVSFVGASTDLVPRERALIPRYADVLPDLAEGVRRARRSGVTLDGYEGMCGVPLCLVPDDLSRFSRLAEVDSPGGEFVKPAACGACALERRCYGVRRSYVELHGDGELRPIAASALSEAGPPG